MAFRIKDLLINVSSFTPRNRRVGTAFTNCPPASVLSTGNCWGTTTHPTQMLTRITSTGSCGGPPTRPRPSMYCTTTPIAGWSWNWWCCGAFTVEGPGPVGPGDPVEWVEQLAILKAELKEALEEVERQESAAEEALKPRDLGEVEELESKLKEALTELERLKKELKQK